MSASGLAPYTELAKEVMGRNFSSDEISAKFLKNVPKSDYSRGDKENLLIHLLHLSKRQKTSRK